jgi:hypothetical protein
MLYLAVESAAQLVKRRRAASLSAPQEYSIARWRTADAPAPRGEMIATCL